MQGIVDIQPKDAGGGGGETRESAVHRAASEMAVKLPNDFNPFEVRSGDGVSEGRGEWGRSRFGVTGE